MCVLRMKYYSLSLYQYRGVANPWFINYGSVVSLILCLENNDDIIAKIRFHHHMTTYIPKTVDIILCIN